MGFFERTINALKILNSRKCGRVLSVWGGLDKSTFGLAPQPGKLKIFKTLIIVIFAKRIRLKPDEIFHRALNY